MFSKIEALEGAALLEQQTTLRRARLELHVRWLRQTVEHQAKLNARDLCRRSLIGRGRLIRRAEPADEVPRQPLQPTMLNNARAAVNLIY